VGEFEVAIREQQACAAAVASFLLVEATLDASHAKGQTAGETP
jgi:hypothetical protein